MGVDETFEECEGSVDSGLDFVAGTYFTTNVAGSYSYSLDLCENTFSQGVAATNEEFSLGTFNSYSAGTNLHGDIVIDGFKGDLLVLPDCRYALDEAGNLLRRLVPGGKSIRMDGPDFGWFRGCRCLNGLAGEDDEKDHKKDRREDRDNVPRHLGIPCDGNVRMGIPPIGF